MERTKKFNMLSVVAYGIHSRVRRMIESAIDSSPPDARAYWPQLRPFYFYEYFLDPPVIRDLDPSEVAAFAPFLKRLVIEHDFVPFPTGGYKRITADLFGKLVQKRAVPMLPINRHTVAAHWNDPVVFDKALSQSLIINLLHGAWEYIESNISVPDAQSDNDPDALVNKYAQSIPASKKACFTNPPGVSFNYSEGVVTLTASFSAQFVQTQYVDFWKGATSLESALREFSVCIYPWLLCIDPSSDAQEDSGLFEIIACSISSRTLFFGELILMVPPIPEANPRTRDYVHSILRSVLNKAVKDLYLPMVTLYENYALEKDLDSYFEDLEKYTRRVNREHGPEPVNGPSANIARPTSLSDGRQTQPPILPWLSQDVLNKNSNFLRDFGQRGRAKYMYCYPSNSTKDTSSEAGLPSTLNIFAELMRFIPIDTADLDNMLEDLASLTTDPELMLVQRTTQEVKLLLDRVSSSNLSDNWSVFLTRSLNDILSLLRDLAEQPSALPRQRQRIRDLRLTINRLAKSRLNVLSEMEFALVELWADRLAQIQDAPEAVRESLVFATYLIASPGMVECIQKAMNIRHLRENASVKTALVIGGAGSGKDSMARLVRLFSPGYRFGKHCTLNMAMLRPKDVAVPFLLGLDTSYKSGRSQSPTEKAFILDGLLQQALDSIALAKTQKKEEVKKIGTMRGFTFVFDELNSLDIDTQGALLRVLENSELQPLGSIDRTKVDFLIIGVMNEDPQMIMKKRTLDSLLRDKELFGGFVGEALYEVFRGQRRLRDDLYYRLARGGEIAIPELRKRPEDIPILFYFIVQKELTPLMPVEVRAHWEIELPLYEVLMDPSLLWEGNVRELQAAARRIVEIAIAEYRSLVPSPDRFVIRRSHALRWRKEAAVWTR